MQIRTGSKLRGQEGEKMRLLAASPVGEENGDIWILQDSWLDAPGLQNAGGREEINKWLEEYKQVIEGWREREKGGEKDR